MSTFLDNVKYGLRRLLKSPGFTIVMISSLALGIGANTVIFSLVNAVQLRALPVRNPRELRVVNWVSPGLKAWSRNSYIKKLPNGHWTSDAFSYQSYCTLRENTTGVTDLMAMERLRGLRVRVRDRLGQCEGVLISDNFFDGLGLKTFMGDTITTGHGQPEMDRVTVISYACWQQYFGLDPDVIGRAVVLNEASYVVTGVLPKDFYGPYVGTKLDFYIPISAQSHSGHAFEIMARLKPGIDPRQVQTEFEVLLHQVVYADVPSESHEPLQIVLEDGSRGRQRYSAALAKPLPLLMGMVAIVLILSCANSAGLLLVRGAARQREFSIRRALGAGRRQLIGQVLMETVVISFSGAGLGLALASGSKAVLSRMIWHSDIVLNLQNDWRIFGFTFALSIVTLLLFGLIPALHLTRSASLAGLRDKRALGAPRLRLGKMLAGVQVGLSLILLTGAGLFIQTLLNLRHVEIGFNPDNLLTFRIDPTSAGHQGEQAMNFHQQVITAVASLPGVQDVTNSQGLLLQGYVTTLSVRNANVPGKPDPQDMTLHTVNVGSSFLSTLGIPLLRGRDVTEADNETSAKVVIINRKLADELFADQDPLGQPFPPFPDLQIVGVCDNFKSSHIKSGIDPVILRPYRQCGRAVGALNYEIRTAVPAQTLIPAVRKAVAAVDPHALVADIRTQRDRLSDMVRRERLLATLAFGFALLAVSLSCLGIYGILAYQVVQRTGEIGIRMALGAAPRQVLWPVLRNACSMALAGVLLGLPVIFATLRIVRSHLWGVKPTDPTTLTLAAVLLLTVSVIAAWIPARRAARIDPMEALRYE